MPHGLVVLLVGLGSPLAMAPPPPPCCLDDALVFPRGYLLVERKHVVLVPIDFVRRVSSAMLKARMDVVFLVPRFHPRDACLLPLVSPCCESV
jgi:hypothetical protein